MDSGYATLVTDWRRLPSSRVMNISRVVAATSTRTSISPKKGTEMVGPSPSVRVVAERVLVQDKSFGYDRRVIRRNPQ